MLEEIKGREDIEVLESGLSAFDAEGELLPFGGDGHD